MDTPEVVVKNIFSDHGYGYGGYGYGGGHGGGYNGGNGGDYGFGHQLSDISSKVDTNAVLNGISGLVSGQHGLSNEIC